ERVGTRRDDEPDRLVLEAERRAEREPVLPERQVERRALEGPAPVVRRGTHLGLGPEELHRVERRRKVSERRPARGFERGEPLVILSGVRHVLSASRLRTATEHNGRRDPRALRRGVNGPPFGP